MHIQVSCIKSVLGRVRSCVGGLTLYAVKWLRHKYARVLPWSYHTVETVMLYKQPGGSLAIHNEIHVPRQLRQQHTVYTIYTIYYLV